MTNRYKAATCVALAAALIMGIAALAPEHSDISTLKQQISRGGPVSNGDVSVPDDTQGFHFTVTAESEPSPGVGHEGHQLAILLAPEDNVLYGGLVTYTASEPVQLVVLHEIGPSDSLGQPIWRAGEKTYGWTLVDGGSAGSFWFAGAGVALHTPEKSFVATATLDGSVYEPGDSMG